MPMLPAGRDRHPLIVYLHKQYDKLTMRERETRHREERTGRCGLEVWHGRGYYYETMVLNIEFIVLLVLSFSRAFMGKDEAMILAGVNDTATTEESITATTPEAAETTTSDTVTTTDQATTQPLTTAPPVQMPLAISVNCYIIYCKKSIFFFSLKTVHFHHAAITNSCSLMEMTFSAFQHVCYFFLEHF